jgi:hypothetical protein
MARQGYDLELRRYDGRGWRAMFFASGFEHSLTSDTGTSPVRIRDTKVDVSVPTPI